MFCTTCGFQMSDSTAACPRCGKASSIPESFVERPNGSPARSNVPATDYGIGRNPYEVPPPYGGNPYDMGSGSSYTPHVPSPRPMQPYLSPQTPAPRRKNKLFFILGGVLVALLVLCGASVYLLSTIINAGSQQSKSTTPPSQTPGSVATDPARNPYPPGTGTLIMSDPMHDNSKGYKWDVATINGSNGGSSFCGYRLGTYHVSSNGKGSVICNPEAPQFTLSNLAFEANITVIQGKEGGLVARLDQIKGVGYVFSVTTDGHYIIETADLNNNVVSKQLVVLRQGSNGIIKQGLHQSNLLALVVNDSSISAFINNQFVDSIQDTTFTTGQLGIYGNGDNGLDISAQDARVWRI